MMTSRVKRVVDVFDGSAAPPENDARSQVNTTVYQRRQDRQRPRENGCNQLATEQSLSAAEQSEHRAVSISDSWWLLLEIVNVNAYGCTAAGMWLTQPVVQLPHAGFISLCLKLTWSEIKTLISYTKSLALSTLLYGCESWRGKSTPLKTNATGKCLAYLIKNTKQMNTYVNRKASQVSTVRPYLPTWHAAKNHIVTV